MVVPAAPHKSEWIPALIFVVIAAALSAWISYMVNKKLDANANQ
jgi:hypothetical protein